MGMYTGIQIDVILKLDVPEQVIDALRYMTLIERRDDGSFEKPLHPLFLCDRWSSTLCCQSAYFPECEESQPSLDERLTLVHGQWRINAAASLKNYDGEIGKFLNWIAPYVDPSQTQEAGWYRYEETRNATFFTFKDGKVETRTETTHTEDWY